MERNKRQLGPLQHSGDQRKGVGGAAVLEQDETIRPAILSLPPLQSELRNAVDWTISMVTNGAISEMIATVISNHPSSL